jgi:hypothetical protein
MPGVNQLTMEKANSEAELLSDVALSADKDA